MVCVTRKNTDALSKASLNLKAALNGASFSHDTKVLKPLKGHDGIFYHFIGEGHHIFDASGNKLGTLELDEKGRMYLSFIGDRDSKWLVGGDDPEPCPKAEAAPVPAPATEKRHGVLNKYCKMLKMGVTEEAVRQKMRGDGIPDSTPLPMPPCDLDAKNGSPNPFADIKLRRKEGPVLEVIEEEPEENALIKELKQKQKQRANAGKLQQEKTINSFVNTKEVKRRKLFNAEKTLKEEQNRFSKLNKTKSTELRIKHVKEKLNNATRLRNKAKAEYNAITRKNRKSRRN